MVSATAEKMSAADAKAMAALDTVDEAAKLAERSGEELEQVVSQTAKGYIRQGEALRLLKSQADKHNLAPLYQVIHTKDDDGETPLFETWAIYVGAKWGMSASYADRQIDASAVAMIAGSEGFVPANEAVAREFLVLRGERVKNQPYPTVESAEAKIVKVARKVRDRYVAFGSVPTAKQVNAIIAKEFPEFAKAVKAKDETENDAANAADENRTDEAEATSETTDETSGETAGAEGEAETTHERPDSDDPLEQQFTLTLPQGVTPPAEQPTTIEALFEYVLSSIPKFPSDYNYDVYHHTIENIVIPTPEQVAALDTDTKLAIIAKAENDRDKLAVLIEALSA